MAREKSSIVRQKRHLARRVNKARPAYDRILIITEGSKTEPNYFDEIRRDLRVPTASIAVVPSGFGTAPLQVVGYAHHVITKGDVKKAIAPLSFDKVFAVFDRDDHTSYREAVETINKLDGCIKNDAGQLVEFIAAASIPSFELWILLHFRDVLAPYHRDEVLKMLASNFPQYTKGGVGVYGQTRHLLHDAIRRGEYLAERHGPLSDPEPYTGVVELVKILLSQKRG
jgi:hypothetical protein